MSNEKRITGHGYHISSQALFTSSKLFFLKKKKKKREREEEGDNKEEEEEGQEGEVGKVKKNYNPRTL